MSVPDPMTCEYSSAPVCPYCGHEQSDAWEWGNGGEGDGINNCGSCGREFTWSRHVSVSYSTEPIVGPHPLSDYTQEIDAEENPL